MEKIALREKWHYVVRSASADQLTPSGSVDRDKGIRSREQVDNSRRFSTLDLFHFGDGAGVGRSSNIITPNLPGTRTIWPKN